MSVVSPLDIRDTPTDPMSEYLLSIVYHKSEYYVYHSKNYTEENKSSEYAFRMLRNHFDKD